MRAVSAIILINLACVYGWNSLSPTMDIDRFTHLTNNVDSNPSDSPNVTYKHIQLHLDHFNSSEKRTIRIWYAQNLDFWQPNGPLYIWPFRGTFSKYEPLEQNNTFIFGMAKETKGAMFLFQERYFPPSLPKIPRSQADKYYNYLSTTQQLADIAEFIKYLKSKPEFKSSKVVLMGFAHEGNHATWMRLVYPNLVDAAVAVSAPLLAKKDAKEMYEFVANLYEKYGHKDCIKEIEKKLQEFPDALKNKTALEIYKKEHHICPWNNFTVKEDQQLYMNFLYYCYRRIPILGDLQKIKDCKSEYEDTPIKKNIYYCYGWQYSNLVSFMKDTKMAVAYQSCTEYGQAPTTAAEKRPFVHYLPLSFSLEFCKDVWGIDEKRMDEGIAQTNLMYGGLTPNVTNVVFIEGELSPAKFLGVQQNLSDSAPLFVVKDDGTYNILYYKKDEPTDRTEVRNRVKTLIKKWIGL